MKILFHLLVLSSLSGLILTLALNHGEITVEGNKDEIFVLTSQKLSLDEHSSIGWLPFGTNSPVNFGDYIKYQLRTTSRDVKNQKLVLKLEAVTESGVLIKQVNKELKFPYYGYSNLVKWTIPHAWYADKLGSDKKVIFTAFTQDTNGNWIEKDQQVVKIFKS